MSQKVIQIGSSAGVTLSRDTLEMLDIKVGDVVEVSVHPKSRTVTMRPIGERPTADSVNPDVIAWTNVFIDKNRKLLESLADK